MAQKKTIVILGGGLGGLPLARLIENDKKLSQQLNVVLVDKKHYFEMSLASPRFLVDPSHHDNFTGAFTSYLKTSRFVCGSVMNVQAQPQQVEVQTANGNEFIPFDYLVIALGTRYPYFKPDLPTLEERLNELTTFSQQIRDARHILIVGGRSVAMEALGEIVNNYPSKEITIVHPANSVMDGWPKSAIKKLNKYLSAKKDGRRINVVLGKKFVRSLDDGRHELSDGSFIQADMKIMAAGHIPNSEPLQQFFSSSLSANGYVKVRDSLQLEGFGNIFAFGDIADLDQPKMGANLKGQMQTILKNLTATLNDKKVSTLGEPTMTFPGLVTLGPTYAILALPAFGGSSFDGKFLSKMKTDMFIKTTKQP